jgi:hypothetical protein
MTSRIVATYRFGEGSTKRVQRFTDWFDFADWLKQTTLIGPVEIVGWTYETK